MARSMHLSQSLPRLCSFRRSFLSVEFFPSFSPSFLHTIRHHSDHPSAEGQTDAESESFDPSIALRQLDDAIQLIVVKRSAPAWLPFIPGSSYWVPPPSHSHSKAIFDILSKMGNALSKEEAMSLTTVRGWPSTAYFIDGTFPRLLEFRLTSNNASDSESDDV